MQPRTRRVSLPEHPDHPGVEQWAEIREVHTLRAGDRKAVDRAVKYRLDEDGAIIREFTAGDTDARDDALLARLIVEWSLELPLPVAVPASLDELPLDIEDALRELLPPYKAALDFKKGQTTPLSSPEDSSGSRTTSPDTASPAASPTLSSSPSPSTPPTPVPSAGPPMM